MRKVDEAGLGRALAGLRGTPRVVASGNHAAPAALLGMIDAHLPAYRLYMLNALPGIPAREGVVHETSFVGPGMRGSRALSYVPARLSLVPQLFATTLPPDVVALHLSPRHEGTWSMGVEVNVLPAAVAACRAHGGLVVAQVNPLMPWTYGDGLLREEDIDLVVEAEEALSSPDPVPPDDAAWTIGERVAARIHDGATLQLGIGMVPDATLPGLAHRRGLAVWSEMFSDGVLALDRAGALDEAELVTASFVIGSGELYAWMDRNPRVQVLRTESTNSPARIARRRAMTSINTALQIDLFGQANASRIGARIHSGFGGQTDFIVGALHSTGGQALMALRSWHPKADASCIVAMVDEPVTSFQHTAVITEQGVAEILGFDERTQAAHLIDQAAHPRVRDELREEAAALGLT